MIADVSVPSQGAVEGWTCLPSVMLRRPGLPFARIENLGADATLQAIAAAEACRLKVARAKAELVQRIELSLRDDCLDVAARREWSRIMGYVTRGEQVVPALEPATGTAPGLAHWDGLVSEWADAQSRAEAAYGADLAQERAQLQALCRAPETADMLLASNPGFYESALNRVLRASPTGPRPSKIRGYERTLWLSVQRFCMRNDTGSGPAGPFAFGRFDSDEEHWVRWTDRAPRVPLKRIPYLSYAAVRRLADALARDPAMIESLRPRAHGLLHFAAGGQPILEPLGQVVPLPDAARRVLAAADGTRTIAEIGKTLSDIPPARVTEIVAQLIAKRLLVTEIPLPQKPARYLQSLMEWLDGSPAEAAGRSRWETHLAWFQQQVGRYEQADTPERHAILKQVARRLEEVAPLSASAEAGARVTPDEMIELVRDDSGSLTLGEPFRRHLLSRLAPIFELTAVRSHFEHQAYQAWAKPLFDELAEGRSSVSLIRFFTAIQARQRVSPCEPGNFAPLRNFQEHLVTWLSSRVAGGKISLRAEQVRQAYQACALPDHLLCSADILLAARTPAELQTGQFTIVVGELHHSLQVWNSFVHHALDVAAVEEDLIHALGPQLLDHLASLMMPMDWDRVSLLEAPGWSVDYMNVSAKPREHVLPLTDLEVIRKNDVLRLRSRRLDRCLDLYPTNPDDLLGKLFALPILHHRPILLGTHTPRIEVEGIVVQRERWDLTAAEATGGEIPSEGLAQLAWAQARRQHFGWPRRVFVRLPEMRKPVYIDLDVIISVEAFAHLLRKSGVVSVTEMLPRPEDWWLGAPGARYGCELRFSAFSRNSISG